MKSSLHKAPRALALVVLVTLATGACVKQNKPGVGVVNFDSTAVFGAPTNKNDIPGFEAPPQFGDELPVDETSNISDLVRNLAPKIADPGPCPPAKLTAFPKASATVKPIGAPAEGVYRWKRALVVTKDAAKNPPETARPFGLEDRAIRHVVHDSDHQFSFEMVAPDSLAPERKVITTFRVNTNPALLVDRTVPARTIGVVPVPGTSVRLVDPGDAAGIYVLSIVEQDSANRELSAFRPVVPMLILPLEGGILRTGETFNSVGIDTSTGAVLANSGTVGRALRIDACGEIVEGYAVALKQTYTADIPASSLPNSAVRYASRNETREAAYVFATQYGALPIAETLSIGDIASDPTAFMGKWELGGLTPAPLPASEK
ncbi:MAG: hypothetical protein QOJ00_1861 [Actinomycetota bacterium]|jgi:hypothetical protein